MFFINTFPKENQKMKKYRTFLATYGMILSTRKFLKFHCVYFKKIT